MSYQRLNGSYVNHGLSWLAYLSLISAIPKSWKVIIHRNVQGNPYVHNYDRLAQKTKTSKIVYQELCSDMSNLSNKANYWNNKIGTSLTVKEMQETVAMANRLTISTALRDFHFRLTTNLLVFNKQLYEWGKRTCDRCTFCELQVETNIHLFWECKITTSLLTKALSYYNDLFPNVVLEWNLVNFLCSKIAKPVDHVVNLMSLLLKRYIYNQRCQAKQITFTGYQNVITNTRDIEYYVARKNNKLKRHVKKWSVFFSDQENEMYNGDLNNYVNNTFV